MGNHLVLWCGICTQAPSVCAIGRRSICIYNLVWVIEILGQMLWLDFYIYLSSDMQREVSFPLSSTKGKLQIIVEKA